MLSGKGGALHTWTGAINKVDPHSLSWSDIAGFRVGDTFDLFMKLHITAAASGHSSGERASFADVSHTGHLYVDVLSGNASVVGASGHQYATSALRTGFSVQDCCPISLLSSPQRTSLYLHRFPVARRLGLREGATVEARLTADGTLSIRAAQWNRRAFAPELTEVRSARPMTESVMQDLRSGGGGPAFPCEPSRADLPDRQRTG